MRFVVVANKNVRSTANLPTCLLPFTLWRCHAQERVQRLVEGMVGMPGTWIQDDSTWPQVPARRNNNPGRCVSRVTTIRGQHTVCVSRGRCNRCPWSRPQPIPGSTPILCMLYGPYQRGDRPICSHTLGHRGGKQPECRSAECLLVN